MTLSASRIASRWLQAATLSPKWFKDQQDVLKAILKRPVKKATDWWWDFYDQAYPWWDSVGARFQRDVAQPEALRSVTDRVRMAEAYLTGLKESLERFGDTGHVDFSDPESYLKWYAKTTIHELAESKVTTIGDLFRWEHGIDQAGLDRLVKLTLKQANPEELASLTDGRLYRTKYEFLARVGFEKKARKLYKRNRLDWDPMVWLPRIQEMLQANYSEQGLQESERFREFDLYGMKVVVDDSSVEPSDLRKYVGYFDQAYKAMQKKGFGAAWYGVLFIQCKECGGQNPNTAGGTGGHYVIGKDTVSVFERPGPFITELVVHELGHRYWFKQMSSEQRARFTALVKTHTTDNPGVKAPHLVNLTKAQRKLQRLEGTGTRLFKEWVHGEGVEKINAETDLLTWCAEVRDATSLAVSGSPEDRSPETAKLVDHLWDNYRALKEAINDDASGIQKGMADFLALASKTIEAGTREWNAKQLKDLDPKGKDWWESYERNPAPVLPVSNYGRSNPDEAFAEVFAHYCLDRDLDRDQLESFRSVLKTAASIQEVPDREPPSIL